MSGTTTRIDPFRGFNFRVEIDNTPIAGFSEVSGLAAEGNSVDYRQGNDGFNHVRKLMGLRKFTPITLKRGYIKDTTLWDWHNAVATGGKTARRNGTIVLRDETNTDVLYFNFTGAFLNKIEGAHMMASGNEVAIESVELVVETLVMQLRPST